MVAHGIATITLALFLSSAAGAATGLFFSTFLHPLLATGATSLLLVFPLLLEALGFRPVWQLFPVAWMFRFLLDFNWQAEGSSVWAIAAALLVQVLLFWFAAALVFARRDVTISPE
jgi:ABC-type transport system involved in multi-copper enzyme maturation permease subunit